jgi:ABC-type transporter Mla subunit MlaD
MNERIVGSRKVLVLILTAGLCATVSQSAVAEPARKLTQSGQACLDRTVTRVERLKKSVEDLKRLARSPAPAGLSAAETSAHAERSQHLTSLANDLDRHRTQIEQALATARDAGEEVNFLLSKELEIRDEGKAREPSKLAALDEEIRQAIWQVHQGEK